MDEKTRFTVSRSVDKNGQECKFRVEDNWPSNCSNVTFHLPCPYTKSQLDEKLEEARIALREDYGDNPFTNSKGSKRYGINTDIFSNIGIGSFVLLFVLLAYLLVKFLIKIA